MANNDYIIYLFVLMICFDVVFFLGQIAIDEINPAVTFYNCDGKLLEGGAEGQNCSSLTVVDNPRNTLPDVTEPLQPTTENIFTDLFNSIKSFFVKQSGLGDIFRILAGPMTFLEVLGLPKAFTFAIGSAWMMISFFLVISFFWGR